MRNGPAKTMMKSDSQVIPMKVNETANSLVYSHGSKGSRVLEDGKKVSAVRVTSK
jgi:hypothetical protein